MEYFKKFKINRAFCFSLSFLMIFSLITPSVYALSVNNEYNVGTFKGESNGKKGKVIVSLTIGEENGNKKIHDIQVEQNETPSFWEKIEPVVTKIKENNGTDGIDTVSSSTISYNALIDATNKALEKANGVEKTPVDTNNKTKYTVEEVFPGQEGTKDDPYKITTDDQFRKFALTLSDNVSYTDKFVELVNDIDLQDREWVPIGMGEYVFNGNFDGKGHNVTGLRIGSKDSFFVEPLQKELRTTYFGLFGCLESKAKLENINIDAKIFIESDKSIFVGGVAGYANGSLINNVHIKGDIVAKNTSKFNDFAAGVVGFGNKQVIINSSSHTNVRAESVGGVAQAGGITGIQNRGLIANCYSSGTITGTSDRKTAEGTPALGGIVGVSGGTITNCYSMADIISDCYTPYAGAITGWATGISDTFQSYFDSNIKLITDDKTKNRNVISPAIPIGWKVGPGVNEENESYEGAYSLDVESLSSEKMKDGTLVSKLNENINKLRVDLSKGGRRSGHWLGNSKLENSLKGWTSGKEYPAIHGEQNIKSVYDINTTKDLDNLSPKVTPNYYPGEFYGRSKDKNLIVKININNEQKITSIEPKGSEVEQTLIGDILAGNKKIEDLENSIFKEALMEALNKAKLPDYTKYGNSGVDIFSSGEGTKENPWIISNEEQLVKFAVSVNADETYEGKFIKLNKDIHLTKEWNPIGGERAYPFKGNFDGDNHTIFDMKMGLKENPRMAKFGGLFSNVTGGTIKNIKLENLDLSLMNSGQGKVYLGAIAAYVDEKDKSGFIDNVSSSGKLYGRSNSNAVYVGGLVGQAFHGTITNSSSNIDIVALSDSKNVYAGGIVGMNAFSGIFNSYSKGKIEAEASLNRVAIGGIAGYQSGVMYNSYADMDLDSKSPTTDVGGLAGRNTGTGYSFTSYYNTNRKQYISNRDVANKKAVGVEHDNGTIGNLIGLDDLRTKKFTKILNDNRVNESELNKVYKFLKTKINPDIKLNEWKFIPNETPVFGTEDKNDNYIPVKPTPKEDNIEDVLDTIVDKKNNPKFKEEKNGKSLNILEKLKENKNISYINGFTDKTIRPNNEISRAEVAQIFANLLKDVEVKEVQSFKDVDKKEWYSQSINKLAALNIISGYEDGTFKPDNKITRSEFTSIVSRFIDIKKGEVPFKDVSREDWFYNAVMSAYNLGWISGYPDNTFKPDNKITRSEVIVITNKVLDKKVEKKNIKTDFIDLDEAHWAYDNIISALGK